MLEKKKTTLKCVKSAVAFCFNHAECRSKKYSFIADCVVTKSDKYTQFSAVRTRTHSGTILFWLILGCHRKEYVQRNKLRQYSVDNLVFCVCRPQIPREKRLSVHYNCVCWFILGGRVLNIAY